MTSAIRLVGRPIARFRAMRLLVAAYSYADMPNVRAVISAGKKELEIERVLERCGAVPFEPGPELELEIEANAPVVVDLTSDLPLADVVLTTVCLLGRAIE